MAAFYGSAQVGGTGNSGSLLGLTANSPRTVIRVKAPTNQRVRVIGINIAFDGQVNTNQPVQVQYGRISADGASPTALTILPNEPELTETFQTSVALASSGNEPTYSGYTKTFTIHPQYAYEWIATPGRDEIIVPGGGLWGIVLNAPAAVNARATVAIEE